MTERERQFAAANSIGVSAAFLLAGYECVRSASNTLYKSAYGKESLPIIMAIMPMAVLALLYAYGWLLTRLGPRRTLWWTSIGCACLMAAATGVIAADSAQVEDADGARKIIMGTWAKPASAFLYLLREAYIVLLIEQYWSFLNSTLGDRSARWFNGPICGIGSLGSIVGGIGAGWLMRAADLPTMVMPFFAAAAVLPAAIASEVGYRWCGEPRQDTTNLNPASMTPAAKPVHDRAITARTLGLDMFRTHRVLIFMAMVVLLTQIVSTMLDLRFQHMLDAAIPDAHDQTAFSSTFFAWVAAVAAVLQFIVAPLLLRFVPLTAVHAIIPCLHLIACGLAAGNPSLATVGGAYLLFKSVDYSVFRAAKEIIYIPLPFDARYRAKEVIDVFGYRLGKGGVALAVEAARRVAGKMGASIPPAAFTVVACVAAAAWVVLSVPMTRQRRVE